MWKCWNWPCIIHCRKIHFSLGMCPQHLFVLAHDFKSLFKLTNVLVFPVELDVVHLFFKFCDGVFSLKYFFIFFFKFFIFLFLSLDNQFIHAVNYFLKLAKMLIFLINYFFESNNFQFFLFWRCLFFKFGTRPRKFWYWMICTIWVSISRLKLLDSLRQVNYLDFLFFNSLFLLLDNCVKRICTF